jgi:hypothetical protein
MCTVPLPPGVNPIAVKHIISHHIISYVGIEYDVAEESAASILATKTPVDCDTVILIYVVVRISDLMCEMFISRIA